MTQLRRGCLEDAPSLRAACAGAAAIVHAASYVGHDPAACQRVNIDGTRRLLDAAVAAGVRRIVYVSTAAVYGTGPHRGIAPDAVPRRPESPASASRLAAENLVRAAGGTVVRPNIVYGAGDRWVLPSLLRAGERLGGLVEGGRALVSAIAVERLGELLASLALSPDPTPAVSHAAEPPRAVVRLLTELAPRHAARLGAAPGIPFDAALERLRPLGYTRHQLAMVAWDHWYA